MASIPYIINNGTPPYTISVKKQGEGFERFRDHLNNNLLMFEAATDGVIANYTITMSDAEGCTKNDFFSLLCGTPSGGCNTTLVGGVPSCVGGVGNFPLTITGMTAPLSFSVKRSGDNTERFLSHIDGVIRFQGVSGAAFYDITIVDMNDCSRSTTIGVTC